MATIPPLPAAGSGGPSDSRAIHEHEHAARVRVHVLVHAVRAGDDNHATAVLEDWAADLKRAGIKTIHGNLIFEYGYMDIEYIHPTWPVNQLVNWYEAPVSSFSMQEGCVQVRVMPGRGTRQCV